MNVTGLSETERIYRRSLEPAGNDGALFEFALSPIDSLGVPLWTVAVIANDRFIGDGFGYGPSWNQARVSALGETLENYWIQKSLSKRELVFGTRAELTKKGLATIDPRTLCLPAGSCYSEEATDLCWVEIRNALDSNPAWCPIEFVGCRYADLPVAARDRSSEYLIVPITNGAGAGPTKAHAIAHGLLELLQRDGNSVSYRALDRGMRIELDTIQNPGIQRLLDHLDRSGLEIIVKLAGTDFGMVNLYVVGYERDLRLVRNPISLSACGEAVHPCRETALEKALYEFVSARARKAFSHGPKEAVSQVAPHSYLRSVEALAPRCEDERALHSMKAWTKLSAQQLFDLLQDPVYLTKSTIRFSELPTIANTVMTAEELSAFLLERLKKAGFDIFLADLSPPSLGVSIVKMIVPGLECETLSYQRIGRRNVSRLAAVNSPLVQLGSTQTGQAKRVITAKVNRDEHTTVWFDPLAQDTLLRSLYPLYREPGRHVLMMANQTFIPNL